MQQEKVIRSAPPFFDILSDAEEIQVREIESRSEAREIPSLKHMLKEFEQNDSERRRAFVVVVRPPKKGLSMDGLTSVESSPPREYLLESAQLLVRNRDYLLARNVYSFLLKKHLRDGEALKGLGICLFRTGDSISARKCFRAYYDLFKEEEGLFWLGLSESTEGNDRKAAEYFNLVKHPEFLKLDLQFEFFKEAGNVCTRIGDLDKAEENYKSAMALEPNSDTIFVNLGTLSMQRNRYEAAHTHYSKALLINPRNARAHCGLGLTAIELGQTVLAEKQFERALEFDSQNLVALSQLVQRAEGDTRVIALKGRVERFLEKDKKNGDARYLYAICEFKLGRYQACQKEVEGILKDDSTHETSLRLRDELVKHLKTAGGTA